MGQKKLSFGKAMGKKIEFLAKYTSSRINDSRTQTVKLRKLSLSIWGLVSVDW